MTAAAMSSTLRPATAQVSLARRSLAVIMAAVLAADSLSVRRRRGSTGGYLPANPREPLLASGLFS